MEAQATFEGYAIVEIMGHNREIGFVTTEYFGGPALFRIDQPSMPEREYELTRAQWIGDVLAQPGTKVQREAIPGKTTYVGPQAIFRLTPCSKETVERGVDEMIAAPIKILHLVEKKRLAAAESAMPPEQDGNEFTDICTECNRQVEECVC